MPLCESAARPARKSWSSSIVVSTTCRRADDTLTSVAAFDMEKLPTRQRRLLFATRPHHVIGPEQEALAHRRVGIAI